MRAWLHRDAVREVIINTELARIAQRDVRSPRRPPRSSSKTMLRGTALLLLSAAGSLAYELQSGFVVEDSAAAAAAMTATVATENWYTSPSGTARGGGDNIVGASAARRPRPHERRLRVSKGGGASTLIAARDQTPPGCPCFNVLVGLPVAVFCVCQWQW